VCFFRSWQGLNGVFKSQIISSTIFQSGAEVSSVRKIFSCKKCGYCCQGQTTVSLNADDRERMVEALDLKEENVRKTFWRVTGNTVQMKTVNGHCIFYNEGCTVHKGRPWRCAQWPLHPSILVDEANFLTISESCPGINKELSYEKFCEILKQIMEKSVVVC